MGSILKVFFRRFWFAVVLVLLPISALGGEFTVKPIKIYFGPKKKITSFTIFNQADNPLSIQMKVVSWRQNAKGEPVYQPTKDLLVFPRLAKLKAKGKQIVRIANKGKGKALLEEKTYRIFVEELPLRIEGEKVVSFTLTIGMPIFVQPARNLSNWDILGVSFDQSRTRILVKNDGNQHMRVGKITADGFDASGGETFKVQGNGWYVLLGNERSFFLPVSGEQCLKTKTVKVTLRSIGVNSKGGEFKVEPDLSHCTVMEKKSDRKAMNLQKGSGAPIAPPGPQTR